MFLGTFEHQPCWVSPSSPNQSVIITGLSGSGKSCKQNIAELNEVRKGNTVIVIDYSQNHQPEYLLPEIRDEYTGYVNRIDAIEDGLNLNLLKPLVGENGKQESLFNVISGNRAAFSAGSMMGPRQKSELRLVLERAIKHQNNLGLSDSDAIIMAFEEDPDNAKCQEVYERLWAILHSDVFKTGTGKTIKPGMINIFDLKGLEISAAEIVSEIILAYLWRWTYNVRLPSSWNHVTCSLDEFQHVSLKPNSTLRTILREGRRFGLSMLLATQTLSIFQPAEVAMLTQTATRLHFKPTDLDLQKVALSIDPNRYKYWMDKLAHLKVGECIAIGNKTIGGKEISSSKILSAEVISHE